MTNLIKRILLYLKTRRERKEKEEQERTLKESIRKKDGEEYLLTIKQDWLGGWVWLENKSVPKKNDTGKYLFFGSSRTVLIALANRILLENNLSEAKVSEDMYNGSYTLCVYDTEPKLKNEMKRYADFKTIHYRWWKSNEETNKKGGS